MEDGVERIVEQVVNPKIMSVIQPEVHIHFYVVKFNILVFLLLGKVVEYVTTLIYLYLVLNTTVSGGKLNM